MRLKVLDAQRLLRLNMRRCAEVVATDEMAERQHRKKLIIVTTGVFTFVLPETGRFAGMIEVLAQFHE